MSTNAIYLAYPSKEVIILDVRSIDLDIGPDFQLLGVNRKHRGREKMVSLAQAAADRYRYTFDRERMLKRWKEFDDAALRLERAVQKVDTIVYFDFSTIDPNVPLIYAPKK